MIECREAVKRLWEYIDRNLERRREEELEQHLGLCRHCCGELEFARQIRERLARGGEEALPAESRARLQQMLRNIGAAAEAGGSTE